MMVTLGYNANADIGNIVTFFIPDNFQKYLLNIVKDSDNVCIESNLDISSKEY